MLSFVVLFVSFHMVIPCEDTWDCKKCTTKKCTFVITKAREYCVDSDLTDSIVGVESLFEKEYLCSTEGKGKTNFK